jgi:Skp family chaperone for outer membrane proteins
MKKMLMVCVAVALSIVTINSASAQTKIGSFDEESLLGLMPGIGKVDTLLRKYAADSLAPKRDYEMMELKRKDSTFRADSAKLSGSLREIMQKEISQHYYIVANWQEISNEAIEGKKSELLAPFRQKIYGALNEIITSEKYTLVLKSESILTIPICDNLSIKTAYRMRLNLPKETEAAFKSANCGGGASTPAPKSTPSGPKK